MLAVLETEGSTRTMNLTWRFYIDQDRLWRWQRLTAGKAVVAESQEGCKDFDECVRNAEAGGYVFQPSRTSKTQAGSKGGRMGNTEFHFHKSKP